MVIPDHVVTHGMYIMMQYAKTTVSPVPLYDRAKISARAIDGGVFGRAHILSNLYTHIIIA